MKVMSFSWTTPALLAGEKTVTRREWQPKYAARFHAGDLIQAWNRQPRFRGAARVATIRLTETPYVERLNDVPDEDWDGEGFAFLEAAGAKVNGHTPRELFEWWRHPACTGSVYVVRFELVEVVGA